MFYFANLIFNCLVFNVLRNMENVLVIGLKRNNESFIEFLFLNKLIH